MDVFLHSVGSGVQLSPTKKSPTSDVPEKRSPATGVASEDSVEASLQLHKLMDHVMSAPDASLERVNRIASAISSGHYRIDPQSAANKLVEFELLTP